MTALIGGAVLLVVASAVALALGWPNANESLLWTSIGTSVGALSLLLIATVSGKRSREATPETASTSATAPTEPETAPARGSKAPAAPAAPVTPPPQRKPVKAPPAGKPAAKPASAAPAKRAAEEPASEATGPDAEEVVAIPDRKRFHRPECRYSKARGAERMTKASARRRAYSACGVCKP